MLKLTVETNSRELKNADIIKYCNKLLIGILKKKV